MHLSDYLACGQQWVNEGLTTVLACTAIADSRIHQAMAYSLNAGGKRIRPLLVRATCEALGGNPDQALPAACAVELIHTYSLIHDDLPAMDNDDLRRGLPTCHKAFDEATAILAGDAMLTLAFEVLADRTLLPNAQLSADICLQQSQVLARAAGARGMIEGQNLDIQGTGKSLTLVQLEALHRHKTGALIQASCALGGLAAGATLAQQMALREFATAIGLAFQVQDDILDVTTDSETLGKAQGADIAMGKNTYVSLLGLEAARREAMRLCDQALIALDEVGTNEQTHWLRELALYTVGRRF